MKSPDATAIPTALPYFLRLPKNATNSTAAVLAANYPPHRLYETMISGSRDRQRLRVANFDNAETVAVVNSICEREAELDCVLANVPYGIHEYLRRPVRYFTIVREPVERGISVWYHAYRYRNEKDLWSLLEFYGCDLQRILDAEAVAIFTNDQVRTIIGSTAFAMTCDDLQLAKELILEKYDFVGTVECFHESMLEIGRRLDWSRCPDVVEHVGIKGDSALLPRDASRLLREYNEWDIRLHEWVGKVYLPRQWSG